MQKFAKVGEIVIYTGDISHAFDDYTASLMNRFLIPKEEYIVREVGVYKEGEGYRFRGFAYLYPCKSFMKNSKELTKILYNLK